MNKHLYRIVFNKARGLLMVVAENVTSEGKAPGIRAPILAAPGSCVPRLGPLRFAMMLALGLVSLSVAPAWASGIVADPGAPGGQRPTIIDSANGTPQVNIQAPSAAGVSRNTYSQFDVDGRGAILNNSAGNTQTQLGGWIEGNPWLNNSSARVILNEVNASNPSQLRGYVEVAGQRAEVVIANPAGISCNGCGFINADRSTLTTGQAQLENGRITGYQVQGGTISITGKGLDGRGSDYTDLIARSVEVNAGIWANDLKVTTGRNQVNADNTQATALAPDNGEKPQIAIDVAQLGGMYAGKIKLVGTEGGVGVRNAGQIGAMAGEVVIAADGKLQNQGAISAAGAVRVEQVASVDNSGSLFAKGALKVASRGAIDSSGALAAQGDVSLSGASVHTGKGSLLAAGIDDKGKAAGPGNLTVSAANVTAQGQNQATGDLTITASNLDLSGSQTRARNIGLTASQGDATLSASQLDADGVLTASASGTLRSDNAKVNADNLQLSAGELSNQGGELVQTGSGQASITASGTFDNRGGRIAANASELKLGAATLDNRKGRIEHAGSGALDVRAKRLDGAEGTLASNGLLKLHAEQATLDRGLTQGQQIDLRSRQLSNQGGRIVQTGEQTLNISASEAFDNRAGQVSNKGAVQVSAGSLNNAGGKLLATDGGQLVVSSAGLIDNRGGTLAASGNASLSGTRLDNGKGTVSAGGTLSAELGSLSNLAGTLAASQAMTLFTGQFDNSGGVIGSVQSGLQVSVRDGVLLNQGGRLEAAQGIGLLAKGIDNSRGVISGKSLDLNSQGQRLDNSAGTLGAGTTLDLHSGELRNAAGLIQAGGKLLVDTGSQALHNLGSGSDKGIVGQGSVEIRSAQLNNTQGFIAGKGDLLIAAGTLNNAGQIVGEQGVRLEGTRLNNQGGQVQARGELNVIHSEQVDNRGGLLRSAGQLNLDSAVVDNSATQGANQGIEGRSMRLLADVFGNQSGALRADENIALGSRQQLDNNGGLISAGNQLSLSDRDPAQQRQAVHNFNGTLIAGKLLSLNAAYYSGNGRALSLGDLNLRLQGGLELGGQIQANNTLDVQLGGALGNSGRLLAGQALLLKAQTLDNRANGEISAGKVDLVLRDSLTNRGLIDGQQVRLQAITLNNLGGGRLYGDQLGIASTTLVNRDENGQAAVIAAREQLNIGTATLENREQALIFSAGDLAIGGALDAAGKASGRAQQLHNASATIEALGNLALDVQSVRNTNEHFSTREVEVSRTAQQEFQISGSPNRYQPGQISLRHDEVNFLVTPEGQRDNWNRYDYTRVVRETQIASSAPAQILSGGNMQVNAGDVLNDKSRIIAGGLLQANIASLTNTEVSGQRTTMDSGTATNFYRIQRKGRDRQGSRTTTYRPAPLIQDIDLKPTVFAELAAVTGSGTQIAVRGSQSVGQQVATAGEVTASVGAAHAVGAIVQVTAQSSQSATGVAEQIRSGGPSLALPTNSLFKTNPQATGGYLIETDPRFASYRNWLSSDYMLQRLQVDPATTQLRLGDGFYEQKLIREQVAQLTGRRFLDGYANDEVQYRALIDNALTVANQWQLVPGVALSAEQMAQLTSDMVWLVEQQVTLANGETRKVLVPQVYVRVKEGDLDGSGALIAGQQLNLNIAGDLLNSGSLAGRSVMALTAQNIDNLGGRMQADQASIEARDNLNNLGGLIGAVDDLSLSAGKDINVVSSSRDSSSEQGTRTNLSRVAGLFVSGADGSLKVAAGNDLNLTGAQVVNAGKGATMLLAGNDVNLATVGEAHTQAISWNSSNWRKDASQSEVGSTVQGNGDVRLSAGQDLNVRAGSVTSEQGAVLAEAKRDISLTTGEHYQFADEAHKYKGSNGLFSSKTTTTRDTTRETTSQGSTLSGEQVYLQAGRDLGVKGSDVVSTNQTILVAGNNVNIEAASDSHSERHDKSEKKSGLFSGGGIAVTVGTQQQSVKDLTTRHTAAASTVGATSGDVLIEAGKGYRQVGSQVMAPNGDIDIQAQQIDILEARNISDRERETLFKQTGISITITNPVISAIQTTQQMKKASEKTEDGRMKALAAATAALAANNAVTAVAADPGAAGGVNISLSLGTKKNESTTTQHSDSAASSTVVAGNDVRLRASGAGADSDITVQGSQVKAGHNASLIADGDINLLAARNTSTQETDSKGSSASVGIGLSLGGTRNGFTLDLGVTGNRGTADGDELTHTNTHVEAGNQMLLVSGGDTNLKGAVVSGKQVLADIGGDLNIESLQDTNTYKVDENSLGFGISLCIPPFCVGMSSVSGASGSFGATDIDSNYASVTEQSAIKAGDGGFDIHVGGNTDLVGAAITSSDKAVADGNNRLITASLTSRDIKNKAEYDASTVSLGGGYNEVGKDQKGNATTGASQTPGTQTPTNENNIGVNMPIAISASDSASSVTRSGISGGTLVIGNDAEQRKRTGQSAEEAVASLNRDVSSDRDGSNTLKPIFNEEEVRAGFEIVGAFANEAGTLLANKAKEVDAKRKQAEAAEAAASSADAQLSDAQRTALRLGAEQLRKEADGIADQWGAGGTYRQITTALVGAASGNISAGNGAFVQGLVVNYVQQQGAGYIGSLVADGKLVEGSPLHAALHGIVACAGAAASSQACGSGAAGAAASSLLTGLFSEANPNETEAQREAKRNLIVSLVTGLAVSSNLDATTANTAAGAAVDNNWLATQQLAQARKELKEADGKLAELQVLGKWAYISKRQDLLTQYGVGKGLVGAGWDDVQGLAQFLAHPIDGLQGMKELISNEAARDKFGNAMIDELNGKIDRMKTALEVGGDDHAVQLGEDLGQLIWQVGSVVTGVGGAAKGGVALAKAGVRVGKQSLETMVDLGKLKQLEKIDAPKPTQPDGFSGGKPTVKDDPYHPDTVADRSQGNKDLYGRENLGPKDPKWLEVKQDQVADVRAGLQGKLKVDGNVAVADVHIDGLPSNMAAHSGVTRSGNGLVGEGSGNFESMSLNNSKGFPIDRMTDAEYKILDNIADKLGNNSKASGTIDLFSELKVCASCSSVIEQFQRRYPNITVNVVANPNGRRVIRE